MGKDSQKQIGELVARLVKEGETRADQMQTAVGDWGGKSRKGVAEFQERIRIAIRDELKRLGVATKSDVDKLDRKIARVEKQLADVAKSESSAPTRPARSPRPARKSSTSSSRSTPAPKPKPSENGSRDVTKAGGGTSRASGAGGTSQKSAGGSGSARSHQQRRPSN